MNEEVSQVKKRDKQRGNNFDWLKEYAWQKGQSGNPAGRPKTKTLKEFARDFLASMSEEARIDYLKTVDPKSIWEMAEGKAKQDVGLKVDKTISEFLDGLDPEIKEQTVADQPLIPNPEQTGGIDSVPTEPSAS